MFSTHITSKQARTFCVSFSRHVETFLSFCLAFFFPPPSFLFFVCVRVLFSQLPSISALAEANGCWKDNGMSSGPARPLHLLRLWHHIGKLKEREKRRGGERRHKGGKGRDGGTEGEAEHLCAYVCRCALVIRVSAWRWAQGLSEGIQGPGWRGGVNCSLKCNQFPDCSRRPNNDCWGLSQLARGWK